MHDLKSAKTRITYIDIMKGYCMLFVMLHHILIEDQNAPFFYKTFYAPFFLTAFFVSAGLTFSSKRPFMKYFLNKIITLIIPLFTLGLINILLSMVISFNGEVDALQRIVDLITQIGTTPLWFIAAMFVYCIVFYIIVKICKNKCPYIAITVSLLLIINIVLQYTVITNPIPWHIDRLGHGVFWIGVGYLIKLNKEKIALFCKTKKMLWIAFGIVTLLYVGVLIISCFVLKCDYTSFGDSSYYGFNILVNGIGAAFILLFSKITPQFKSIQFIGRSTLFYFAFHGKVQSLLFWIFEKIKIITWISNYCFITSLIITIVEALILVIPCILFDIFIPFTVGKKYDKERIMRLLK